MEDTITSKILDYTKIRSLHQYLQYQVSIGRMDEAQLLAIKNVTTDRENILFILSHLIQDYSTHDHNKYYKTIQEYARLYFSSNVQNMSSYIHFKAMCNMMIASAHNNSTHDIEEFIKPINTKMGRKFTDKELLIAKADVAESLIEISSYWLNHGKSEMAQNTLNTAYCIYRECEDDIKFTIIEPMILFNIFKICASSASTKGDFKLFDSSKDYLTLLVKKVDMMLANPYETIAGLNFYDKDNVELFLCIIRFIIKLQDVRELKSITKLENITDLDKQYALSNMGISHKSKILRPNINMRNSVDDWFTSAIGYIRMAGGTTC